MRKLFITMVAIATVVTSASAESGQFRVGATAGLELSNMLALAATRGHLSEVFNRVATTRWQDL